ncbi:hypothetical protein FJ872_25785 [Mesorhizobium sp. B2-5-9]|uniref:hypothetical protein n=1 Tax=Mesorhizobium sp. B2-5-9 TaxID=2589921 RepID=UPI00112B47F8|nr:hypothetical protein [Mesorhizobium sp. B2-5-9]TPK05700.1 hypothetical protein FJ872_25785 [Mesorhizobium sp. B2-5-9]
MTPRNQITAYVILPGLIVFAIGMIVFALATGQIRGKFGWIYYADNPVGFWNWIIGYVIGAASLTLFLWWVHIHGRK